MTIDFGVAKDVEARSTGEPGQRTFHLRIIGEVGQSASLKLEKQHLVGLLTGLRELLAKTKGCVVEVIMKDISTVRYEPRRLWEWARIAAEETERYA